MNILNRIRSKKTITRSEIFKKIFSQPEHSWINENKYIQANIEDFLSSIKTQDLNTLFIEKKVLLLPSNAYMACAISTHHSHLIIIFPKLMHLLKGTIGHHSFPILAHELGHIFHSHGMKEITPLEAQVEADQFACEIGYAEGLENIILDMHECVEKRVRLSYITRWRITNEL